MIARPSRSSAHVPGTAERGDYRPRAFRRRSDRDGEVIPRCSSAPQDRRALTLAVGRAASAPDGWLISTVCLCAGAGRSHEQAGGGSPRLLRQAVREGYRGRSLCSARRRRAHERFGDEAITGRAGGGGQALARSPSSGRRCRGSAGTCIGRSSILLHAGRGAPASVGSGCGCAAEGAVRDLLPVVEFDGCALDERGLVRPVLGACARCAPCVRRPRGEPPPRHHRSR